MPDKGEDNLTLATRLEEKRNEIKGMDSLIIKEKEVFIRKF